jgi:hypothetical protein
MMTRPKTLKVNGAQVTDRKIKPIWGIGSCTCVAGIPQVQSTRNIREHHASVLESSNGLGVTTKLKNNLKRSGGTVESVVVRDGIRPPSRYVVYDGHEPTQFVRRVAQQLFRTFDDYDVRFALEPLVEIAQALLEPVPVLAKPVEELKCRAKLTHQP